MTTRQRLNRRMRWIGAMLYAGIVLLIAGVVLRVGFHDGPPLLVFLPGFALLVAAAMSGQAGVLRCPQCRNNLGPFLMQRAWTLSMDRRVCFCPFCGIAFDEDSDGETTDPAVQDW